MIVHLWDRTGQGCRGGEWGRGPHHSEAPGDISWRDYVISSSAVREVRARRWPSRAVAKLLFASKPANVFLLPIVLPEAARSHAADADARHSGLLSPGSWGRSWDRWWRGRPVPGPTRGTTHRWWLYLNRGHLSGGTRWYSHYPNGKLTLPVPICLVTRFHLSVFSLSCCPPVRR